MSATRQRFHERPPAGFLSRHRNANRRMVGSTLARSSWRPCGCRLTSRYGCDRPISGGGWFTLQIAKVARHVCAIDIDPNLLEVARHRLAENGLTNCDFVTGDAYDIAKLTAPADFVFLANAFHGVPDRHRLAKAVDAALKSHGRFAIVNWHTRPREETPILGEPRGPKTELRMSPEETIKSVEAGGLKFTNMVEIPPYHYGVVFEGSGA